MSRTMNFAEADLPPGPGLPSLVQTALMWRDPVGFLERCRRDHGPIFRVRFVSLGQFVYVAEPELARQVFATDRDIGRAGEVRREFLAPLVGDHSLLCLEGEEWLRQRKLLGPAFHGRQVQRYREEIAAIAREHIDGWPIGRPFELRPRVQAITLEVIIRLVFGIREGERLERLRSLVPQLIDPAGSAWIWLLPQAARERIERVALIKHVPRNPLSRFYASREALDAILYDEIAARRRQPRAERDDVLSLLLEARDDEGQPMTDVELRDELVTLLEAGHETTATALSWAFERLLRNAPVLERLSRELSGEPDGEYLEAVVKETLRSRPVVVDTPRLLHAPLAIGGYRVPAGWYVAPAIPAVHRSPSRFPAPDDFEPERFLGDDAPTDAWIPFGGGRRRCLGSHLALLELKTVIAEVLSRVELSAAGHGPERQRLHHVTLVPERQTRVVATRRVAAPAAV